MLFGGSGATECGKRFFTQNLPVKSWIVGGDYAVQGAYPWQVSLQTHSWLFGDSHICGATIISEKWIVTAAHCVADSTSPNAYRVVVGEYNLNANSASETKMELEKVIIHKHYDNYDTTNDIALLRVKGKIDFTQYVQPACLPNPANKERDYKTGTPTIISGWGEIDVKNPDDMWPGRSPSKLHAAMAPLMSSSYCASSSVYGSGFDDQAMICAGYKEGGVDSCQGDSGGPLVAEVDGKMTLLGVVSWGAGCASAGLPGVYTFVANYVDWVAGITGVEHQ